MVVSSDNIDLNKAHRMNLERIVEEYRSFY